MGTNVPEEQAQQESNPFILCTYSKHSCIYISICVGIRIINNNIRLLIMFDFLNLTATVGTYYCRIWNKQ